MLFHSCFRLLLASLKTLTWKASFSAIFFNVRVAPFTIMSFQVKVCTIHTSWHMVTFSSSFRLPAHIQRRFQAHSKLHFSLPHLVDTHIFHILGKCKGGMLCIRLFSQKFLHNGSTLLLYGVRDCCVHLLVAVNAIFSFCWFHTLAC